MTLPCEYDLPLTGNGFCQYYAPHNVYHPGTDLNSGSGNMDCGNNVFAPRDGVVVFQNTNVLKGHGFGVFIILKHEDGTYTRYAHLKGLVNTNKKEFKRGELLGWVGNTGTQYCHLHFEVFNEKLAQIQSKHYAPWCFYPAGQTVEWVREHYLDPFVWLKQIPIIPDWAKKSVERAKVEGIITDWSNPYEKIGNERLEWTLEKLGLLEEDKHEGHVTLLRWAVVLDKHNLYSIKP